MSVYKTGRSTDYSGSETTPKHYTIRPCERTEDIIEQFERMSRGLAPVAAAGNQIVWVQDSTLTPELREWCAETAAMVKREAEIKAALKPRKAYPIRRSVSQIESEIAAVLALRPDATAHDVRLATGIEHRRIVKSEAWICAHMGKRSEA